MQIKWVKELVHDVDTFYKLALKLKGNRIHDSKMPD